MAHRKPLFLLTTVESDSHMWNLVYLELLLQEQGVEVVNLGPCVAVATALESLGKLHPDAVLVSSVNGHGLWQGQELREAAVRKFNEQLPPFLIGGKLTTSESDNASIVEQLRSAGFAEVFIGAGAIERFREWLELFKHSFELSLEESAGKCRARASSEDTATSDAPAAA
jgi:methylaspartate mutase sigma subunit